LRGSATVKDQSKVKHAIITKTYGRQVFSVEWEDIFTYSLKKCIASKLKDQMEEFGKKYFIGYP